MLRKLRKPGHARNNQAKKWMAYFVFGLICLVFVFFTPIGSELTGYGGSVVASVGRETLSSREYGFIEEALRREYAGQLNTGSEADVNRLQENLRKRALRELIQLHVVAQGAERNGLIVSDQEVMEEIRGIKAFQEKGRFVYSLYNAFLRNQNWNSRYFEDRIRRQIRAKNWNALFVKSARSNRLEREMFQRKDAFQVNLRFVEMDVEQGSSEELEKWVKNQNRRAIAGFLSRQNKQWKTTGNFSPLQNSIPQMGDKEFVLEKVRAYLPYKGLLPEVIKTEGKQYLVDILSFQRKKQSSADDFHFLLDFNKPKYLFDYWMNHQEKSLGVSINHKLFSFSDSTE